MMSKKTTAKKTASKKTVIKKATGKNKQEPLIYPRFTVKNLGTIEAGEFTQKPLTIFCGPNNSGKTWAMYPLYCSYNAMAGYYLQQLAKYHKQELTDANIDTVLPKLFADTASNLETNDLNFDDFNLADFNTTLLSDNFLERVFNAEAGLFADAEFHLKLDDSGQFGKFLSKKLKKGLFLMPAERSGLHLFFRELSNRRTSILHEISKKNANLKDLLSDVINSPYALPIAMYIDWLNGLPERQRQSSGTEFHHLAEELKKTIVGGAYKVDKMTGDITFKPYQTKRGGHATQSMGLHIASSTVTSLFSLWFYLEYQAKKGDILMIDEPELNIHPENQRKIARLLAKLVNAGLNIVISTHSDYIVREFNTLIMLNKDKDGKLQKKHKYTPEEVLDPDKVGAYLFEDNTIKPFEVTPEDGIYATTFDEVINDINKANNDIYYSLQDGADDDND